MPVHRGDGVPGCSPLPSGKGRVDESESGFEEAESSSYPPFLTLTCLYLLSRVVAMSASPTEQAATTNTSTRQYPISNTGIAHIPRAWIRGGPDHSSLCEYLKHIWKRRWAPASEARKLCSHCRAELRGIIAWYEDMEGDFRG